MKSLLDDLKVLAECDDMAVWHKAGETNVGDVARRCLAALSPEAPAEGAGEDFITTQSLNDAASDPEWCAKWNREPSGEWSEGPTMTVTLVRHQVSGLLSIQKWDGGDDFEPGTHVLVPLCLAQRAALRARSSAPEARNAAD